MSMPPLTHSRHVCIGQSIGDGSNRTLSAVAFARLPAQEAAAEAHTMRMGKEEMPYPEANALDFRRTPSDMEP